MITGMLFLMIPAFSAAIFGSVSPSREVCSSPMLVMTLNIGTMMFVASSRPPSPVSITATSTSLWAK